VEEEGAAGEGDLRRFARHLPLLFGERRDNLGGLPVVDHRDLILFAQAVDERGHRLLDVVLDAQHRPGGLDDDDDGSAGLRRFPRSARHLNSNSMSPSLTMSLSIRSCFCTFSSLTKVPFELSRSAIWNSPPSYRMVACLREIFLSVSTMSQSAAVPSTFFPTRRRKSSPLCWPLSATIQPHTSRLLSWDPRPFSPPISWMLSMAVPWPADGIGMAETPPPAAIIACCISRQYGQVSQLGCITWPFGQILPCCLSFFRNGRMRSTMARNDTKGLP